MALNKTTSFKIAQIRETRAADYNPVVRYHFNPQFYIPGAGFRKPEKTISSFDKSEQMAPKFVKNTVFFLHGIGKKRGFS